MKTFFYAALTVAAATLTNPAEASIVGITSNTSLGAFDSINWNQIGPSNVTYSSPQNVVSDNGVQATVSSAGNQFRTFTQDSSEWDGNFVPGTTVLSTFHGGPDITISLANAAKGFGAQIQSDSYGAFTAQITAYNASGSLLGSFTENGISNSAGDGSAIFIGLLDDNAEISKIVFNLITAPNGTINAFALDSANLSGSVAPAVPEASTWAMIIIGFSVIGLYARCRRSNNCGSTAKRCRAAGLSHNSQ